MFPPNWAAENIYPVFMYALQLDPGGRSASAGSTHPPSTGEGTAGTCRELLSWLDTAGGVSYDSVEGACWE